MSWAGLASNQCITYNNLKDAVDTGVFEKAEAAVPPGSLIITRAVAEQYVVINPITSKAMNQLPVKSDLTPSTGAFKFNISDNGTNSAGACALFLDPATIAWCNTATPVNGTVFYADYRFTTIFPMSSYAGPFLHYKTYGSTGNGFRARFDTTTSTINSTPVAC
ncbi:MAG: hypothetical protein RL158_998 [Bacteroidota bacterium]|jgi:hypothetical protein